jgi:methionine sulfoxide reductase heme-binding subunit
MSVQYGAISWNRQKKVYDITLLSLLVLYLGIFVGVGTWRNPSATAETLLIRALGTAAFLLLNVVLCIGPLSRLDRRFLPLLYNRRHLGVTTFLLGLAHGGFVLVQFHALGNVNPLVSLFISNPRYSSVADFPFQALGFVALIILFLMAATSHDFWLRNLSAPMWKRLHMLVYVAYALLVAHVTLGALQSETSPVLASALMMGVATVLSLHLAAAFREKRVDWARHQAVGEGFVEVCKVERIAEKCATIVSLSGERIAVFRYDDKVSAISNVCQHQNGPLGEGRIIVFAIEAGHEIVGSMLSGRDQQIARIFVLLPDFARTRDQQRWERPRHDDSLKTAHLPVFEHRISERHLSNNQHQSRGHGNQTERNNDLSHKTSQCCGRLRQITYVEVVHRGCASLDIAWADSILAGSTRVPGGLGRGCTKTDPSTTFTRKVGTFSLNGGGAAPDSG